MDTSQPAAPRRTSGVYGVREPDPANRRARVVRLTAKGRELETVIRAQAQHAEEQIAEMLGPRRFTQLQAALDDLVTGLPRTDQKPAPG